MSWSCYLYFDSASEGSLFSQWSEKPVENALARWTPAKGVSVPEYLTKNGGRRMEVVRQLSVSRTQSFYRGYAEYIKEARKYSGSVENLANDGGSGILTILLFLTPQDKIYVAPQNQPVPTKDYAAVAIVPHNNNVLEGIKSTTKGKFIDTVTQAGYYALGF